MVNRPTKCECGNSLPPYKGVGVYPRKCTECRAAVNAPVVLVPRVPTVEPELVTYTRRALGKAGRLETHEGANAMALAVSIAAGGHTGAAHASLSREYRASMQEALAGAQGATDEVSDLGNARRARIAGA